MRSGREERLAGRGRIRLGGLRGGCDGLVDGPGHSFAKVAQETRAQEPVVFEVAPEEDERVALAGRFDLSLLAIVLRPDVAGVQAEAVHPRLDQGGPVAAARP